jgi:hypothetical protein
LKKILDKDPKFDSILSEAIDEALSVCGERAKSALYTYLEKALNIPKPEIPTRINEFSRGLEDLFGVHAHVLEILIMKYLHSKIEIVWKWPNDSQNLTFQEYVSFARKHYEDPAKEADQINVQADEYQTHEIQM